MMTSEAMHAVDLNDAELVAESLRGNRDAFRRIVERYQTLVSSLAYCATGNVTQSEDLAQETFVAAWKQLPALREPAKLRPWLCSITRFLISKEFRRLGREPVHAAETLEAVDECVSPEPLPPDHAISEEEKAILWRSLERIPQIYREPLVLFYREHQSIEVVARNLDLSEDVVKQRLSRGRKLLHEHVLAFVAAALEGTKPDKAFALGVLAALPLITTTAKAATAGVVIKGGSTVKATTSLAMLGALLTAGALFEVSLLAFLAFTGGCIGYMMARACGRSAAQLQNVTRFWRALALGYGIFLVFPWLFGVCFRLSAPSHPGFWRALTLWLGLFYGFIPAILTTWIWRWWQGLRHPERDSEPSGKSLPRRFVTWLALGMLLPAVFSGLVLGSLFTDRNWTTRFIAFEQVQKIITEHKDAAYKIEQWENGSKMLWITLRETKPRPESTLSLLSENGIATQAIRPAFKPGAATNASNILWMRLPETSRQVEFFVPADDALLAALAKDGIAYTTSVQGRDYDQLGLPWRLSGVLAVFLAPIGLVIALHRPWRHGFQVQELERRRDERAAKNALKAFAVAIALVLLTGAIMLGLMTPWSSHAISTVELQRLGGELKAGEFTVYQFNNGTKELWISLPRHPILIAPATQTALAALTDQGIHYRTCVQGRDFGYNQPRAGAAGLCIALLVGAAGLILWRVSPKVIAVVAALVMIAFAVLLGLRTSWHARSLSMAAARSLIMEHAPGRFELLEYSDGSRELWITPRGGRHYPGFIAPADESLLALLADQKIAFRTFSQGRDFGYGVLRPSPALLYVSLLAIGAGGILWWAWRKQPAAPAV